MPATTPASPLTLAALTVFFAGQWTGRQIAATVYGASYPQGRQQPDGSCGATSITSATLGDGGRFDRCVHGRSAHGSQPHAVRYARDQIQAARRQLTDGP